MLSGEDIKQLRERLDLRQAEFGRLIGIQYGSEKLLVGRWERETDHPPWMGLRHMRTLTAAGNAMGALDIGRNVLALQLLEDIFAETGAVSFTDESITKMRVRNANYL
jgi:transcriptional regulator with XRE-family HTH domain